MRNNYRLMPLLLIAFCLLSIQDHITPSSLAAVSKSPLLTAEFAPPVNFDNFTRTQVKEAKKFFNLSKRKKEMLRNGMKYSFKECFRGPALTISERNKREPKTKDFSVCVLTITDLKTKDELHFTFVFCAVKSGDPAEVFLCQGIAGAQYVSEKITVTNAETGEEEPYYIYRYGNDPEEGSLLSNVNRIWNEPYLTLNYMSPIQNSNKKIAKPCFVIGSWTKLESASPRVRTEFAFDAHLFLFESFAEGKLIQKLIDGAMDVGRDSTAGGIQRLARWCLESLATRQSTRP